MCRLRKPALSMTGVWQQSPTVWISGVTTPCTSRKQVPQLMKLKGQIAVSLAGSRRLDRVLGQVSKCLSSSVMQACNYDIVAACGLLMVWLWLWTVCCQQAHSHQLAELSCCILAACVEAHNLIIAMAHGPMLPGTGCLSAAWHMWAWTISHMVCGTNI